MSGSGHISIAPRSPGAIKRALKVVGRLEVALIAASGQQRNRADYTSAGAQAPDLATVTGLHVARRSERHTPTDELLGTWHARPLDDLGVRDQWMAAVRTHSVAALVRRRGLAAA